MATSYTSLLGLALPTTGELQGTWGDTVNNSITSLLDSAVAGTTTLSTDGDVTLTTTTGAANQSRQAILLCSGARTALRTITAPAQSKIYTIINATTGGFSVKLVGVGPTTGVTIVAGESAVCAWNGSDFIKISNTGGSASFTNVTVSGTTTLSGLTASTALALDGSKNVVSVTNTGSGNNVLATSPTLTTPNLGTPSALTLTNATGLPLSTGVTGTLATTNGGTGLTSFTANGVVYASSTSALATGSALTFDGSNFKLTGSDNNNLVWSVNSNAGNQAIRIQANVAGLYLQGSGTVDPLYITQSSATGYISFRPASDTERMRLDSSGNLGIGTSSPNYRLTVQESGNSYIVLQSATAGYANLRFIVTSAAGIVGTEGAFPLVFRTSDAERMRLDSSGNLGIGTSSPTNGKLEVQTSSTSAGLWIQTGGTTSSYTIADFRTGTNLSALQIFGDGSSSWRGGNMVLDSSGNLGLGVTPSAWGSPFSNVLQLKYSAITGANAGDMRFFTNAYYDGSNYRYIASANASRYDHSSGGHIWFTAPSGTAGNAISFTQAMTLDASGNLGVGQTSLTNTRLWVESTYTRMMLGYNNTSINYFDCDENVFRNRAGSERARIDSSGRLLVGTTSTSSGAPIQSNGAGNPALALNRDNAGGIAYFYYNSSTFSAGTVGDISITSSTTSYNTSSDYRLKNTVTPMTGALAKVAQLKPVTYKWNADGSDGEGFIAHELAEVCPQAVTGEKDAVDEDGNPQYQGIDTSFLVATLTAALQEAHGLIKDLQARVDALEAK